MQDSPADRLELHLCREFVQDYISRAVRRSQSVKIDPSAIYMAAKFRGLNFSLITLERVLAERMRKST